jgi:hypothetical protein
MGFVEEEIQLFVNTNNGDLNRQGDLQLKLQIQSVDVRS